MLFHSFTLLLIWPCTTFAETIELEGLIEPYDTVEIGSPAEGIVTRVTVDRASFVEKGQVLVELDSTLQKAALAKARTMTAIRGELDLQEVQLQYAKRIYDRIRAVNAITTNDKDRAATEIILTQNRIKKAQESIALARHELKKAEAMLDRCAIKSPIPGVVVEKFISPGEFVSRQPLLQIVQLDPLLVEVIVPARLFGRIRPGMTATIIPDPPQYGEQLATVTIVDRVIHSASSTFGVRLELPNKDYQMPSGMKCSVQFVIDEMLHEEQKLASITP